MFVKYETADNAFWRLGGAVNTTQTTITLSSSQNIPAGAKTWIWTLTQYANDWTVFKFEKVKVTNNVTWTLTVVRWFDGTTAETFNQDDYIFLNVCSEIIKDLQEQAENPVKWEFKNQTGSTIPVLRVVQATGALGASGKMTAAPFIADGSVSQIYALGISRTAVLNGGDGEALAFWKIHWIDTTGAAFSETWSEGDVLYCSATVAGWLTKVKPGATHLAIPIAMVINVHANNWTIAVRVPDTYKLGELHDVSFTSMTTGDSIFRHASWYWYNAQAYTKTQIDAKINAVNGIAGLNGSGQLDPSVLPVLATTETVIVTDQTAMLALTSWQIQKGDIAVQSWWSTPWTRWLFGGWTISDINNWILLADTTPEWSVIAGKPTTVSWYWITDAVTLTWTQTITWKTISLLSNTISWTAAQFNASCSDYDFIFAWIPNIYTWDQNFECIVSRYNNTWSASLQLQNWDTSTWTSDKRQISFWFAWSNNYWHFIHSRHNWWSPANNALDFYICNWTSNNSISSWSTRILSLEWDWSIIMNWQNITWPLQSYSVTFPCLSWWSLTCSVSFSKYKSIWSLTFITVKAQITSLTWASWLIWMSLPVSCVNTFEPVNWFIVATWWNPRTQAKWDAETDSVLIRFKKSYSTAWMAVSDVVVWDWIVVNWRYMTA